VRFDRHFAPGDKMKDEIATTTVDPEIAKMQEPYAGTTFEITIDRLEPELLFSFRWHPFAVDHGVDYTQEPTTLIEFRLEEAEGGVLLTVTESGFDRIPLARRAQAFAANEGGWAKQLELIQKYLVTHAS